MSLRDIKKYLDTLSPTVRKNVEIVSTADLGQDHFLHLSPDRMERKSYIPRIGERQAPSEDRTVPRVTVSPTIFGCYVGYSALHYNLVGYKNPNVGDLPAAGLYIYELGFEFALKPNKSLVYDSEVTGEHWLVGYNEDTAEYKGVRVGKLFADEAVFVPVAGKRPRVYLSLYVEVTRPGGLQFSPDIHLEPGLYHLKGVPGSENTDLFTARPVVTSVSRTEFMERKKIAIATLSDQPMVSIPRW